MKTYENRLIELMPELEKKIDYYKNKTLCKRSHVAEKVKEFRTLKEGPQIIDTYKFNLRDIDINLILLITSYNIYIGAHIICLPYSIDNRKHLYFISKNINDKEEVNEYGDLIKIKGTDIRVTKFSHYYLEKYSSKNQEEVSRYGSVESAVLIDIFSDVKDLKDKKTELNSFNDPSITCEKYGKEKLFQVLELLSAISEDPIFKLIDIKNTISVIKTRSGFGIYKYHKDHQSLITYISEKDIAEEQKEDLSKILKVFIL